MKIEKKILKTKILVELENDRLERVDCFVRLMREKSTDNDKKISRRQVIEQALDEFLNNNKDV